MTTATNNAPVNLIGGKNPYKVIASDDARNEFGRLINNDLLYAMSLPVEAEALGVKEILQVAVHNGEWEYDRYADDEYPVCDQYFFTNREAALEFATSQTRSVFVVAHPTEAGFFFIGSTGKKEGRLVPLVDKQKVIHQVWVD